METLYGKGPEVKKNSYNIDSVNQMGILDQQLNAIKGKVTLVQTRKDDRGNKIRVIKVKKTKQLLTNSEREQNQKHLRQVLDTVRNRVEHTVKGNEHRIQTQRQGLNAQN